MKKTNENSKTQKDCKGKANNGAKNCGKNSQKNCK